ncbi:SAM-dependent methyltransferase [Pseudonocardia humida]|uniref:SAM-dependent methyltransferase n=1 Tax=Pseudonocardia humida TaxID=2800819 RepID=A0ABT0ZYL1_9PSEU|nr:SAM-dependent methyltransferase [Pseudonocardia humida]MCO1655739.1 SAM-dependent methyltransferase [Pseudonocardia humida]
MAQGSNGGQALRDIDVRVPHSARIWNYWLGGKDNFQADRDAGDEFLAVYPEQRDKARACRQFLYRAVRHLALEEGVRQFLDIGTGLPTANNTHEVAQAAAPESKIVYVDNDPLVLAHARALLTSSPEGVTNYIDADLHDPDKVLDEAAKTLDFDRPIALLLIGVLGHVQDYDEARSILSRLLARLPSGSFLVESDGTDSSEEYLAAVEQYADSGGVPYNARSYEQIAGFYEGLEVLEPGVVDITQWRPAETVFGRKLDVAEVGGIGRKR